MSYDNLISKDASVDEVLALEPNHTIRNIVIGIFVLVALIWSMSAVDLKGVNEDGARIISMIVNGILHPNLEWLFQLDPSKTSVPWKMIETISIAFLGTIIGSVLAIPFAFFSSRNIVRGWSYLGIIAITMVRTFPVFILGLMFIKVTGPGAFAGVLTIGVSSVGMITKLYIEAIEDIDRGILDALDSAGCTAIQKIRYGIIPQLSADFISTAIYRFEINVRNATVLGLVGAGGIGMILIPAMAAGTVVRWKDAGAALYGIVVIVLIIEFVSTTIRKKLARGE
jgi:phosphonate transport system permease protein